MDTQVDKLDTSSDLGKFLWCYNTDDRQGGQLSISSVTVTDSEDVHFGDRTYYEGPVVIKQYILTDSDEELENEPGTEKTEESDGEDSFGNEQGSSVQEAVVAKSVKAVECTNYQGNL